MPDYLSELNPAQHKSVVNTEGPSMIIAGAGSGKTRVLTCRIAYLVKGKNVDPFGIMALTFTNKAATEMRSRIEKIAGQEVRNMWMGTFHSVFTRILRVEGHHLGYTRNFTIYDTEDTKSLLKKIVKEFELDDKIYKPNIIYARISGAKNRFVSPQEYINNPIYQEDDQSARRPKMGEIYKTYAERCFRSGAMDFDDLLFNTNTLFRDHLDILNKYQQRFQYLMIDEFQDTNILQYRIAQKLAAVRQNVCVVGDDAQSIYAFRGADIQNILNFEKDYPDLKIFKLEQNYRSTKNIVHAANGIIARNKAQLKKNVWTNNEEGDKINLIKSISDNEEGKLVATSIFEEKMNHQMSNADFAVLYRTNSQSRAIEEALRKMNIKYKIIGGLSFYQRKEIKDLLAYFRLVINPNDEQALRRIINLPKRGIGIASVDKIVLAAFDHGAGIWEVVENISKFLDGKTANSIRGFADMINAFRAFAMSKNVYDTVTHIAKRSGLMKELYDDKTVEGVSRYQNVQELLNAIKEFADNPEIEDKSLEIFLQEVALLTNADTDKSDPDVVTLMTIHAAKGLEFPYVYVVGMEEDLFPSQMMLSSRSDIEEERRLFYVAVTRAKKKLCLSYAISRYRFGRLKDCEPSRFLTEVDSSVLLVNRNASQDRSFNSSSNRSFAKNLIKRPNQRNVNAIPAHKPSPNFTPSDTSMLKEGMKVEHLKFGFGLVTKMDQINGKAQIRFDGVGEKTLLLSFAKLSILD